MEREEDWLGAWFIPMLVAALAIGIVLGSVITNREARMTCRQCLTKVAGCNPEAVQSALMSIAVSDCGRD